MSNRTRYNIDEVLRNTFYQFPKFLLTDEFKGLSAQAKILYSVLKDRHELSVKNKWIDDNGDVYLICSREEMQKLLNVSNKTVTKNMEELRKFNLIDEQRRGQGKVNFIYLLSVETLDFTKTCNFYTSKNEKNTCQDVKNLHANNTYSNNTYSIDNNSLSSQSQTEKKSDKTPTDRQMTLILQPVLTEMKKEPLNHAHHSNDLTGPFTNNKSITNDFTTYKKIIQENIEYNHYLHNNRGEIELIDELINCMLDVICTKGDTVKINCEEKSRSMVISQYLKVNSMDIEHILDRYKGQRHKITHLHSYLKTMLYTVKQENGHYYTNAVRADCVCMAKHV